MLYGIPLYKKYFIIYYFGLFIVWGYFYKCCEHSCTCLLLSMPSAEAIYKTSVFSSNYIENNPHWMFSICLVKSSAIFLCVFNHICWQGKEYVLVGHYIVLIFFLPWQGEFGVVPMIFGFFVFTLKKFKMFLFIFIIVFFKG